MSRYKSLSYWRAKIEQGRATLRDMAPRVSKSTESAYENYCKEIREKKIQFYLDFMPGISTIQSNAERFRKAEEKVDAEEKLQIAKPLKKAGVAKMLIMHSTGLSEEEFDAIE